MHASALLLEVARDPDPAVLARWLPAAEAVAEAAAVLGATADALPAASAPTLADMFTDLSVLHGLELLRCQKTPDIRT